jgi:geranylgeranyl diphosphate synthase type II
MMLMTTVFSPRVNRAIETEIDTYFKNSINASREISASYQRLWENLYALIKSGGKRFRPNMTMLAYDIFGGKEPHVATPIAAAQEALHLSLLIHDDIIDREHMRYGVPNMSGRYRAFYRKHIPKEYELDHFSLSAAILGGDLMLAAAHELISKSAATPGQKQIAHDLLAKSIFDVAGGELMDTEAGFLPYTPGDALKIALYKTARYSFVIPLLTGAKLAHATKEQQTYLQEYAESLGIAYQLVDDLLGVFGDEKATGKSVLGDIREGKQTLLVERAMEGMNTDDKILFNLAFGNPNATSESISQVKELLASSGGKQKTEDTIALYKNKALKAAAQLGLDSVLKAKLVTLAEITTERKC